MVPLPSDELSRVHEMPLACGSAATRDRESFIATALKCEKRALSISREAISDRYSQIERALWSAPGKALGLRLLSAMQLHGQSQEERVVTLTDTLASYTNTTPSSSPRRLQMASEER